MVTEDYVSFETAKLLKEKGFEGRMHTFYTEEGTEMESAYVVPSNFFPIYRPTLQMAMKWLREEKGIAIIPVLSSVLDNEKFLWDIKIVVAETNDSYSQGWVYETQESACETAIKYCLENLI